MSAKAEARETAYGVWRECGQNLSETERRLNRDGLPVSRQTLTEWREKYDWEGRAARAEAEESRRSEALGEQGFLSALIEQKERYEQYFKTLPIGKLDNQALYAYSAILKTLVDLKKEVFQPISPQAGAIREIRTREEAVAALSEALEARLNAMLANPEQMSLSALKDIKQALDLLKEMQPKQPETDNGQPAPAQRGGLTAETAEEIRRQILGVKS